MMNTHDPSSEPGGPGSGGTAATVAQRLQRAAGGAVSMQALFSGTDQVLVASEALQPFLHHAADGRLGWKSLRLTHGDNGDTVRDLWHGARDRGDARGDVTVEGADGQGRTMEISLVRLEHDAEAGDMLLQMHDVTEARAAQRQRVESDRLRLLARFAGRVAHEVNNPLGGLKNAALLLRRHGGTQADRERYAEIIDREVNNIAQVVRELYEALQWGDVARGDASLPDMVRSALGSLDGRRDGVEVEIDIDRTARWVGVPEAVVRLLVYTMLRHAFKASPAGGSIYIRAHAVGDAVVLRIDDEGMPATAGQRPDLLFSLPYAREVLEVFGGSLDVGDSSHGGISLVTRWPMAQPQ